MSTPDFFPVDSRVILKGLKKAPELNGKIGVVKSGLFNGRQHVMVEELDKSVALKVSNLSWEGREIDTLSVIELKTILKTSVNASDAELSGIDKSELESQVASLNASPEKIAQWLAEARTESQSSSTSKSGAASSSSASMNVDPSQAASQLASMNPEQLRQQARMMRSMPPAQIRRMNPQMANFTDAQIQQAASQMEMMASNPAMMKMAAEQMKNMSAEDLQRAQQQAMGGAGSATQRPASMSSSSNSASSSAAPVAPSAGQAAQAASMMENMTPEQLKQQADMFSSMPPDQIRRMNPQLAHMTDDQIRMAATQFRMMADNPEMMKMAADQMKNMSPEQLENIRNGKVDPATAPMGAGADPAQMLANMDKKQLKSMLQSLKENPEMLKQFAASSGMSEDQLAKGVDMFANMEDDKLDMAVNMMQRVQKAKDVWTNADVKTGGHLLKILILMFVIVVGLLIQRLFFSSGVALAPLSSPVQDIPNIVVKDEATGQDEFESEF